MRRAGLAAAGVAVALLAGAYAVGPWRGAGRSAAAIPHAPVLVLPAPRLAPVAVRSLDPALPAELIASAARGARVPVQLTAYCLRGLTKLGDPVRPGIVAADPRLFPLGRRVRVYVGRRYRGTFEVRDVGRDIKGARLDIWMSRCADAIRFGRRRGAAALVEEDGT